MNVGDKIRSIRKEKKIKMSDLAKKLGISVQAVSQYELNKRDIGMELIQRIADALEVSISDLLGNSETHVEFDYSALFSKDALDESTILFNEDQKSAFNNMYDRALKNLGIIEGLRYGDIHFSFVDFLYLSVSFTEIFRDFNNEAQQILDNDKSEFNINEVNSSIELTAKYTFQAYKLLRKTMNLIENSDKFYTENPDHPYYEKEIFEKFLDK